MPLIPGINQPEVKANAANTPYFSAQATADAFGNGIGKAMIDLGTELGTDAPEVRKLEKKPAEKTTGDTQSKGTQTGVNPEKTGDTASAVTANVPADPVASNAIDVTNGFKGDAQSLQEKFFQLNGKAAVEALPQTLQGLEQLQSNALAKASSPDAADLAQSAITGWRTVLQDNIQRHALAQQLVYDDDLDNVQIAQSLQSVRALYNDDGNFLLQLHAAVGARVDQLARQLAMAGPQAGPDAASLAIKAAKAEVASSMIATRIDAALDQGDITVAATLHARWSGDLLAGDREVVTRRLKAAQYTAQLGQETQRAASK